MDAEKGEKEEQRGRDAARCPRVTTRPCVSWARCSSGDSEREMGREGTQIHQLLGNPRDSEKSSKRVGEGGSERKTQQLE